MTRYAFSLISLLMLVSAGPAVVLAQEKPDRPSEEVSSLDLFDTDVEETDQGWSQLYMTLGLAYLAADGVFAARTGDGRRFTIINFDRAGLDDNDVSYWISATWRSADSRWGAWFGSWRYEVTGSRFNENELPIGDRLTVPAGVSVNSDFDAQWFILEATYSLYRSEQVDFGAGIGVHAVDLDTSLSWRAGLGGLDKELVSESLDTLAPLPNVLGYLHWKFAPRWSLVARLGWFGLDYGDFSGRMVNGHAIFNYELSKRWSLGAGYQLVDLDLDVRKDNYTQVYDISFHGPMAFARFNF